MRHLRPGRRVRNVLWRTLHIFVTDAFHTRCSFLRTVASMTKTATPWGAATVVEQLSLPQRAGDKRFASVFELLETARGDRLVRFAYSTDGVVRRGPVTLRVADLDKLRRALAKTPELAEILGLEGA